MIREAMAGDAPRIDAFLKPQTETSMFLRGNLARHGLFERDHPHGTRYFLAEEQGQIRAVFGCTNGGYLMCQAPDAADDIWPAFARALAGSTISGMTGDASQVERTLAALGLHTSDFALNHVEPLYMLSIGLEPTPEAAMIRPATEDDRALLIDWFAGYVRDTEPARSPDDITSQAVANADRAISIIDTQILLEDGEPRAMTAVNSRVEKTVQVSGVYVPPSFRGKGLGGKAVVAHLSALRHSNGVTHAVLFAQNPLAARAYERVGFRQIGEVRIARLHSPVTLPAPFDKDRKS